MSINDERRELLDEIEADIMIAKRLGSLPESSIATLEKTRDDLKKELDI